MTNSVDPDQLASQINWSGSTLFAKAYAYPGSAGPGLKMLPVFYLTAVSLCYVCGCTWFPPLDIQKSINDSNTDGSFTMAKSNSFLSP